MVGKFTVFRIKMRVGQEWAYCLTTHTSKEMAAERVEELVELGHSKKDLEIVSHICWEVL